jgi:hypothetical protein
MGRADIIVSDVNIAIKNRLLPGSIGAGSTAFIEKTLSGIEIVTPFVPEPQTCTLFPASLGLIVSWRVALREWRDGLYPRAGAWSPSCSFSQVLSTGSGPPMTDTAGRPNRSITCLITGHPGNPHRNDALD